VNLLFVSPLTLLLATIVVHDHDDACVLLYYTYLLQAYMFSQVNDNGVISFGSRYNVRTPLSFPLSGNNKIIAPYWADVDTRRTGNVYYRQTTDPSLLMRTTSEIRAAYPRSLNTTISNLLIATWDKVGYYSMNSDKVIIRN